MIFRTLLSVNRRVPKRWNCVRSFSFLTIITLNRALARSGKLCPRLQESHRKTFQQLIGVASRPICVRPVRNLTSSTVTTTVKQAVEVDELREMLASKNLLLIDVREPYELKKTGKIPGAINIPLKKVPEAFTMDAEAFQKIYKAKKPEKSDSNIVFHCKAGIRSKAALEAVQKIGYKKAKHFPGGHDEWEASTKNQEC